jgi:UMF1 family MFS transporter
VAIAGSYLFANISKRIGNIKALLIAIGLWVFICLCAYLVNTQTWFYVIGMGVGLVLGGIQSLSRATYAKLIPENTPDLSSYFSFYDVLEKVSIVMGTFVFGLLGQMTGNLRASVLSVAILFIIGGLLLLSLQKKAKFRNPVPQP